LIASASRQPIGRGAALEQATKAAQSDQSNKITGLEHALSCQDGKQSLYKTISPGDCDRDRDQEEQANG
jgi:hypothetical protein